MLLWGELERRRAGLLLLEAVVHSRAPGSERPCRSGMEGQEDARGSHQWGREKGIGERVGQGRASSPAPCARQAPGRARVHLLQVSTGL